MSVLPPDLRQPRSAYNERVGVVPTDAIDELRDDRLHGGSWAARIAVEAVAAVADSPAATSGELLERMVDAGRELAASRPGLVAVAGALGRLLATARRQTHLPVNDFRRLIQEEAQALVDARDRAAASIAIQLSERLDGTVVLTHSNSSTVREAFVHTPPRAVLCVATAPHEEGRRLALDLELEGIDVEVIEDADAAWRAAKADLVLVGADTVFRCGTLENKVGTRPIAVAATAAGVPFVVACEVIKLAPITAQEAGVAETHGALFDLTAPGLVTEIVTEEGAYPADEIRTLVDRTPFLREGWPLLDG
jgi:translation initiation factor 2B subunit (eIF-2B alpha/beta/delta family)